MTRVDRTERLTWVLFAAHCAMIVASATALTTFLAGSGSAWLARPESQRALRIGWMFSGPSLVALGTLATLVHAGRRFGWRRALALFVAAVAISLTAELVGTGTGYPFGAYAYTPLLGYRIGGRVPFPIPMSWFYMLYASLSVVARGASSGEGAPGRARRALEAGALLTAWDAAMDPAMVRTSHWIWRTEGFFYGMPLSNWFGWLLVGTIIAWVALSIVPAREWSTPRRAPAFPPALYVANTLFPVAICVRHGLWWAALLGAGAAAGVIVLASRKALSSAAADGARRPGRVAADLSAD